ncbi:MAG: sugar phosphate isomerase/epimerase [Chitinophagaceae bacterium]|nr:sugar phosphate isomerase/epimerase [Chitinophagaceae bacterium]
MKSAVTIALVPQIKTGPWVYWNALEESMEKASVLGFDAVELFTADAAAIETTVLKNLVQKWNTGIAAVGTGAGKVIHGLTLTDPDPAIRTRAISFIKDMIDFGAQFRAPAVIGSMQGNVGAGAGRAQSLAWLAEGLNSLGKRAEEAGVPLIYEPLNRYETNLLNRFDDAVEFIDTLTTTNIKLLADLFHMNIEERSIPATLLAYGRYTGHVHFADSNRKAIGWGHTAINEIAAALQEINYTGYISAEIFPLPSPDAAALQTIRAFNTYFKK